MAASYKRIAQLLEKWPVDKTKTGRDFGEHLKKQIEIALSTGKFNSNLEENDKTYLALKRIIENEHMKQYPRNFNSSATGLTAEQCKEALSDEFLEILKQEDQPFYKRGFFSRFTVQKNE